jgi:hypothetical protein
MVPVFSRNPWIVLNSQLPQTPPTYSTLHFCRYARSLTLRSSTIGSMPYWGKFRMSKDGSNWFLHQSRVACDIIFHAIDPEKPVHSPVSNLVPLPKCGRLRIWPFRLNKVLASCTITFVNFAAREPNIYLSDPFSGRLYFFWFALTWQLQTMDPLSVIVKAVFYHE